MARVLQSRKFVGLTLVALLVGLGIGQAMIDRTSAQAKQAPRFEVDPFWPKPMPNNWVLGQTIGLRYDDRDHVWIIHRGNDPANLDRTELAVAGARLAARQRVLQPGAAGARVRRRRQPRRQLGRPGEGAPTSGPSRTTASSSTTRASSGSAATAARRAHPEVHARRQVRGAVRQGGRAQGSEVAGRQAGLHREQHRHGQLRPRRQDLHRPQGQRRLRRRRLPQPPRRGHRPRHRQDQAHVGRLRQAADRREPRPRTIRPRRAAQQFRNPVHCAEMSNDGLVYVCDRPNDRVQVFTKEGKFVKEHFIAQGDAVGRLGVGHRVLEGPAAAVPLHGRRRQRARAHLRPQVDDRADYTSATAAASPGCSSACTASPPTRRATSTRPRPTPASACRSSCTRASARSRRRPRRRRRGRRRRATRLTGQIDDTTGAFPHGRRARFVSCCPSRHIESSNPASRSAA